MLAVVLLSAACSNPAQPGRVEEPTGPNTLTSAERAAGWRLLFNGTTTAGWRGFRQAAVPGGWQAVDGALTRTGGGGDLITIDQFANFELAIQWQIAEGGNSGIMFRVSEAGEATHLTGPEMQVLDNLRHSDGRNPLSSAGACYGLYAPSQDVTRPAGAWNDVRVVVNGARIEHWLNDVKMSSTPSEAPTGCRDSTSVPIATSPLTPVNREGTSRSRTMAIAWRIAGSRSGRCRSDFASDSLVARGARSHLGMTVGFLRQLLVLLCQIRRL